MKWIQFRNIFYYFYWMNHNNSIKWSSSQNDLNTSDKKSDGFPHKQNWIQLWQKIYRVLPRKIFLIIIVLLKSKNSEVFRKSPFNFRQRYVRVRYMSCLLNILHSSSDFFPCIQVHLWFSIVCLFLASMVANLMWKIQIYFKIKSPLNHETEQPHLLLNL